MSLPNPGTLPRGAMMLQVLGPRLRQSHVPATALKKTGCNLNINN